jgi:hypothetical protein
LCGSSPGARPVYGDAVEERFLREDHRAMLLVETEPRALIQRLRRFEPASVLPKWIDREQT